MKRLFLPGEEWLYLKLYLGPDSCDDWLSNVLPALLSDLIDRKLIKSSFFIRYLDPSFHLRIRFKLCDRDCFSEVVHTVRNASYDQINSGILWNFEIGTYERELDRFREDWIEYAELIFEIDSRFWLSILPDIRSHNDGENLRWKAALLSAHYYFNSFSLDLDARIALITRMVDKLKKEMAGGKRLRLQIDEKYRKQRNELELILDNPDATYLAGLSKAISHRSVSIREIDSFQDIIGSWESKTMQGRVSDLIHLSLNRGLRSKHRMHELVIYSFLRDLYLSSHARES